MAPVEGTVVVPGSKSIANRALAIAALADGDSELFGLPDGDDTVAMLDCLAGLGISFEQSGDACTVAGRAGTLAAPARLHAALAGTTSRFVTAIAALADGPVTIDGDPPLRNRPMSGLHDALRSLGAKVEYGEAVGHLPVTVTGPVRRGGDVSLRGDVSSQFTSALMMIGPLLDDGLSITLTTPLVSLPYVRLTAALMEAFGVGGILVDEHRIMVPAGRYRGRRYRIEPDASSASYPLAVAAVRGGTVTVPGLVAESMQGDVAILDLLGAMGCDVIATKSSVSIARRPNVPLRGIDVDMADISDLVPTVAAVAVTASTPTTIRGVGFIRTKESDRLGDLAGELRRTGAAVDVTADGLHIEPAAAPLRGAELDTHHDHRLAMAFAVLGSVVDGVVVTDPGVVTKSWPGFWEAYDGCCRRSQGAGRPSSPAPRRSRGAAPAGRPGRTRSAAAGAARRWGSVINPVKARVTTLWPTWWCTSAPTAARTNAGSGTPSTRTSTCSVHGSDTTRKSKSSSSSLASRRSIPERSMNPAISGSNARACLAVNTSVDPSSRHHQRWLGKSRIFALDASGTSMYPARPTLVDLADDGGRVEHVLENVRAHHVVEGIVGERHRSRRRRRTAAG